MKKLIALLTMALFLTFSLGFAQETKPQAKPAKKTVTTKKVVKTENKCEGCKDKAACAEKEGKTEVKKEEKKDEKK